MEDLIVNTLMPLLQALVLALVGIGITFTTNYIRKKTGIELDQAKLDFIHTKAHEVVLKAEARAERYLVEKGEKWTGSMKHADAVNKFLKMVPDLTHEEAKHYVDMAVAKIPGIGKIGVQ